MKLEGSKTTPEDVVRRTLDALEAAQEEVAVDEPSRQVKQGLPYSVYLTDILAGSRGRP